ncbi:MAG: fatty acid desaturase [Bdellovibrionales bacterium]|nr:fatty acid desaturase [Bdellovibrionales bacterium]
MKTSWTNFRKDRLYLVKYFGVHFFIAATILSIQSHFYDFHKATDIHFSIWSLVLFPLGLIIGVKVPVLMHNCVHRNLRPPILNFIAGELAGVYILMGLAAFELNHIMHHSHSDTELDPHNPHRKNFLGFLFANNFGGTKPVLTKYLRFHGDTKTNRSLFSLIIFMHFISVPMRIAFWFMLLGPTFFVTVFIPSYLFHMFVFAHINFITHETKDDGSVEVYNMNSNLYYKLVNYFGSGVYFHKNHHMNPGHYNPRLGASQSLLFK